jgi:MORN repeat
MGNGVEVSVWGMEWRSVFGEWSRDQCMGNGVEICMGNGVEICTGSTDMYGEWSRDLFGEWSRDECMGME